MLKKAKEQKVVSIEEIREEIEGMLKKAKEGYDVPYQNKEDYDNWFGKTEALGDVLDLISKKME